MIKLTPEEVKALLNYKGQKNVGVHKLNRKAVHWPYCSRCGLVKLKNKATKKELRKACVIYE